MMMAVMSRCLGAARSSDLLALARSSPLGRATGPGRREGKFSYAKALRKALRLAFGIDAWQAVPVTRKNGRSDVRRKRVQVRGLTARERELFEETPRCRPVDFHSFRRAYVDGAARSGLNAQTAMQLTGHTNYSTHRRYQSQADVLRRCRSRGPPNRRQQRGSEAARNLRRSAVTRRSSEALAPGHWAG